MRDFISSNGGGLGNRMGAVISAYYFANLCNKKLYIYWQYTTENFETEWGDLFDGDNEYVNILSEDAWNLKKSEKHIRLLHDPENPSLKASSTGETSFHHRTMTEKQIIELIDGLPSDTNIFYHNDIISNFISPEFIKKAFQQLFKPNTYVLNQVNNFCNENNVSTDTTIGCHIRATDGYEQYHRDGSYCGAAFTYEGPDNHNLHPRATAIENIIKKNPNVKVFVCSDSKGAEEFFINKFPQNVIVYSKRAYTEKYDPDSRWKVYNPEKYPHNYNVVINTEAAVDGLIDCIILGNTNMSAFTGVGTFYRTAKRYHDFYRS